MRSPANRVRLRCMPLLAVAFLVQPSTPLAAVQQLAPEAEVSLEPAPDRWTPALSMEYRQIQATAISADGSRVAYVVREAVMEGEKSEYRSHIWLAAADGSSNAQYTRGEHSSTSPAFSPAGGALAFMSARSGKNQIWLLPLDGGEALQVTDADPGVGTFAWSPDGRQLAFTMQDPETEDEKGRKREKRDVILVDQTFKYAHLYVVDLPEGSEPAEATRITEGAFHVTGFSWTPDGQRLVFSHQDDPRINTARRSGDVSVVDVEGGDTRVLVQGRGVEGQPHVSPDGRWVAFSSTGGQPEPVGLADVYVVPLAGGPERKLAETPDRAANVLGWSARSDAVFVTEAIGTDRVVMAVPLEGPAPAVLSEGEGVLGAISFAAEAGRMVFTHQTADQPADVFVSEIERYQPRQLTDLHGDVPRPPMGRTEVLRWAAPDGTPVEGLLTYPVEYREGQRYPLVLNVHGGPAGVFSQTFTGNPGIYMIQTFAQEGMAVLRPNPRGSTGYGKDFRYANVMDWGYGDLSDLLAGVDHVIEMGVADADSLLLMGWSYGGYMTSFAVTQTDRFLAASMGAGLPNLISMVTTTDIQDYLAGHMGGEFWDDYATYEKHSAIYQIKNVVTPTQVIHGAEDLRVPFTQGQEFYRALDRKGVPTEMVVYPRTPHGPQEPKFLMDVTDRILVWFRKHMDSRRPTAD